MVNRSLGTIWEGPGDGTSPFSNSVFDMVDTAVDAGAFWANSAGNSANSTWYGEFSNPDADAFLNFTDSDEGNAISLSAGQLVVLELRWEDSW